MSSNEPLSEESVIHATRLWLERAVIGLNLCPFAKAVHVRKQIRYVVCQERDRQALLASLQDELRLLVSADPAEIDTTLLIHPFVLGDFHAYNDFLDLADETLEALELDGIIQIASFHPQYQFAGTAADDSENNSNRSPYPILHLLRESSIDQAVAAFPDASEIFNRNIATLEKLGNQGWKELMEQDD